MLTDSEVKGRLGQVDLSSSRFASLGASRTRWWAVLSNAPRRRAQMVHVDRSRRRFISPIGSTAKAPGDARDTSSAEVVLDSAAPGRAGSRLRLGQRLENLRPRARRIYSAMKVRRDIETARVRLLA
jgi:hypothetical protein